MTETRPFIRLRGRSIMALVLTPEPPLESWLTALDAQIERAPNFFDARPVIVDLGTLPRAKPPTCRGLLRAIASRRIHIIRHRGRASLLVRSRSLGTAPPRGRQSDPAGRNPRARGGARHTATGRARRTGTGRQRTGVIADRPPRSAPVNRSCSKRAISLSFGSVASGAEVAAGGSIHVYGALRGRARSRSSAGHPRCADLQP